MEPSTESSRGRLEFCEPTPFSLLRSSRPPLTLFALPFRSVTHQLHFLPSVDYIYTVENGTLAEQGTYTELIAKDGAFSRLMRDFGNAEEEEEEAKEDEEVALEEALELSPEEKEKESALKKKRVEKKGDVLIVEEERYTGKSSEVKTFRAGLIILSVCFLLGAVGSKVVRQYFSAGNGAVLVPLLLFFTALSQAATVLTSYFLVWWQEDAFGLPIGAYMGCYAALAIAQVSSPSILGASFSGPDSILFCPCDLLRRASPPS